MIFRVLIDFYQSGNLVSLAWTIQANDRLDAIAGVRCELEALTRCQQFDRLRIRDVVEVGQHFQPIDLSIPVNGTPPAILRAWASYQTYQDWAQRLTRRNGNDCDVVLSPDGVCYLSWGIGTYALPQVGRGLNRFRRVVTAGSIWKVTTMATAALTGMTANALLGVPTCLGIGVARSSAWARTAPHPKPTS